MYTSGKFSQLGLVSILENHQYSEENPYCGLWKLRFKASPCREDASELKWVRTTFEMGGCCTWWHCQGWWRLCGKIAVMTMYPNCWFGLFLSLIPLFFSFSGGQAVDNRDQTCPTSPPKSRSWQKASYKGCVDAFQRCLLLDVINSF